MQSNPLFLSKGGNKYRRRSNGREDIYIRRAAGIFTGAGSDPKTKVEDILQHRWRGQTEQIGNRSVCTQPVNIGCQYPALQVLKAGDGGHWYEPSCLWDCKPRFVKLAIEADEPVKYRKRFKADDAHLVIQNQSQTKTTYTEGEKRQRLQD